MAYAGYGYESISYDELNGKHAALNEAACADERYDERQDDAAAVSVSQQERGAAAWDEGAPGCLAAVVFAQWMQRKREARVQPDQSDGVSSCSAVAREHAAEDR